MRKRIRVLAVVLLVGVVLAGLAPSTPANATTCPCTMLGTATPATVTDNDPKSVELGVRFTAESAGTINAIRFYKGPKNLGTHTGHLWTSAGTLLSSVTLTGETASGWQQANFAAPVSIQANTTYVASYLAPKGEYSVSTNYFASKVDKPPLHMPANAGVYVYGSKPTFPTSTFQSSNYWVDVVYQPSTPADTTPPVVTTVTPTANATNVGTATPVTASFSEAVTNVSGTTLLLKDSLGNGVPGAVTYDAVNHLATLTPSAALAANTTYTATLKGGASGIKDVAGNALASDFVWSFTTAAPAPPPLPPQGAPILLVTSSANPFTSYLGEILKGEGLNEFDTADISTIDSNALAAHRSVLLGDMPLTGAQVSLIATYVTNGGNLVAMHPDKQLASLLGLTDASATTVDQYLKVSNSSNVTAGIVQQTMQFHGSADDYTLNGALALATLYAGPSTATSFPAVTVKAVGSNGGQAAAFTYDLSKSVVETRQGNPAWAGQDRDGDGLIRSDDLYFGNAANDPQSDWVNLNKVQIPQADEQQHILSNLLTQLDLNNQPVPKFWFLPDGKKAAVIMTGDDHGNGGTTPRFNTYEQESPANCNVANWECVRATSYVYAGTPITQTDATNFTNSGFELASHISSNCANWTPDQLAADYTNDLSAFAAAFPNVPAPVTNRLHCIAWSDWDTQAHVENARGIRLDTSYYYYPPSWINNHPGLFTGSGQVLPFADANGTKVDDYQAATQMTDESGQTYPYNIDTLLDNATGSNGYYSILTANMHTDNAQETSSDQIVASAQAHGVPVVSAKQMLTWLDGRNASSFSTLGWDGTHLTFHVNVGSGAQNLIQAMVPVHSTSGTLTGIAQGSTSVSYTVQTIKGVEYAFFNAGASDYTATYTADSTGPVVASVSPASGATTVNVNTTPSATFSEALNAATVNPGTVVLKDASGSAIAGAVSYNANAKSVVFAPSASLPLSTTLTLTVKGGASGVKDVAGNALVADFTSSFTTDSTSLDTIWPDTATPGTLSAADASAQTLGVKFRSDTNTFVTGVRFYKGPANTGSHTGALWTAAGQQLATGTFTNETAGGWQTLTFASPISITANTTYVASYFTPTGGYAFDSNGLATQVNSADGTLHALASGADGGNGVYVSGSAFPNQSFNSSNYWVDVVTTNQIVGDTTPPTVTSTSPSQGATNISTASAVSATFSEPVNPTTVNATKFTLNASGATVSGSLSYNNTTNTATFTPTVALASGASFTVSVSGVKDVSGNVMASTLTWSFTTTTSTAATIWPDTASPSTLNSGDTSAVELGVKIRSSVAGTITGVRFYKGTANTGTHTGSLWSSTGQLLAQGSFTSETASGWQTLTFGAPVSINANTTYVASYHAPVGNYADTPAGLATAVTGGPLTALANGTDGGDGVYAYGSTPAFPSASFNSTNYWVDVVFQQGTPPPDTTPPAVVSTNPSNGSTNVAVSSNATVTFSEPVDPTTINSTNITLATSGGTAVPASVSLDTTKTVATLTPTGGLAAATGYVATVANVKDLAGNTISAPYSWSFATAAAGSQTATVFGSSGPSSYGGADSAVELGMKFTSDVAGNITAIRFNKSAGENVDAVNLWSATGALLASDPVTASSGSGWQTVNLPSAVAILANTTYVVSYHSTNGFYAFSGGYFANGVDAPPLHAPAGNGVFSYGATSSFPTSIYNNTNYWVDPVLTY